MRYRYRRGGSGYSRASKHISERAELSKLFGGIDKDIEKIFLNLPSAALAQLLAVYSRKHGVSAASYARQTYPKWKRGQVRLSGQTAQRLLELIPPILPETERFDLIRKLRLHHLRRSFARLKTETDTWQEVVRPAVDALVEKSRTHNLPQAVLERATWLSNGDSTAMIRLLSAIEQEESQARLRLLDQEFDRIRELVDELKHTKVVKHTISLPQGTIEVEIHRPKSRMVEQFSTLFTRRMTMDEPRRNQLARTDHSRSISRISDQESILDAAMADLNPEQAAKLRQRAVEERLNLEVNQVNADARFYNSSRDMGNTLNLVKEMDRTLKTDYDIRSQFNTASGTTDIHVKKNNNVMIMVVAIVAVIAIIVFVAR